MLLEEKADCILTCTGQEEVGSCSSHQRAVLSAVDQLQIVNAVGSCMLGASMETENLLVLCCWERCCKYLYWCDSFTFYKACFFFMTTQHCLCSILFMPIVVSCFYYKEPVISVWPSIDFAVCHRWASHSMVFLGRTHFTITRSLRCLKGTFVFGL